MQVKMKSISAIRTKLKIQPYGPTHKYFAERCRHYMNEKYVPALNGPLANASFIDSKCNIIYVSPYAHYQYKGIKYVDPITGKSAFFSENYGYWSRPKREGIAKVPTNEDLHYTKPGTGPYWDRRMVSNDISKVEKEVELCIKRGGK